MRLGRSSATLLVGRVSPRLRSAADKVYLGAPLDHTADVQLHAWGTRLEEAFEQCALAMFALMTELETVGVWLPPHH